MSRRQALGGAVTISVFEATVSTDQQEMNLATWATGQGWNGTDPAQITIASGVYAWSDNTATPALTTGSFPNGLTLIVEGYIMGKGGNGGNGGGNGQDGGPAMSLGTDITIVGGTNGYIGGGGGGGGGFTEEGNDGGGGGGAGGGDGGEAPGDGGAIGQSGENGTTTSPNTVFTPTAGSGGGSGGGGGEIV